MSTSSSSAPSSSSWCCSCPAASWASCSRSTTSPEPSSLDFQKSDTTRRQVGQWASPADPYLLRVAEGKDQILVVPCETTHEVASQRGPRGMPPAPLAALPARTTLMSPILEVDRIVKRFGGVTAVDHVSLSLDPGRIYGLIGPNGSGKTTLFNCITGVERRDEGRVVFGGGRIDGLKPWEIAQKGIGRTFQLIRVFPELSALENLLVVTRDNLAAARERALELLRFVKLEGLRDEYAGNLSYGQQKLLEFVRVLMREPTLILLDEPAAGVNRTLLNDLLDAVRHLRNQGRTVLLVEHDVKVVMGLCETVFVLDHGEKIAEGAPGVIQADERVIEAYFGR